MGRMSSPKYSKQPGVFFIGKGDQLQWFSVWMMIRYTLFMPKKIYPYVSKHQSYLFGPQLGYIKHHGSQPTLNTYFDLLQMIGKKETNTS